MGLSRRHQMLAQYKLSALSGVDSLTVPAFAHRYGLPRLAVTGNSVQSGAPTPAAPIAIASCGTLVTSGEHAGQYAVTVRCARGDDAVTRTIYLDAPLRLGDEIDFARGKLVRKRAVKVFDGTALVDATLARPTDTMAYIRLYAISDSKPQPYGAVSDILCSHVPATSPSRIDGADAAGIGVWDVPGRIRMRMPVSLCGSDTTSVKAYFAAQLAAGTPITVDYELATPVETDITPQIVPVLGGATIITIDGDTAPAAMACDYLSHS